MNLYGFLFGMRNGKNLLISPRSLGILGSISNMPLTPVYFLDMRAMRYHYCFPHVYVSILSKIA